MIKVGPVGYGKTGKAVVNFSDGEGTARATHA